VLGSQHTGAGGDRKGWAPASQRTPRAVAVASRHGVDILGTQELQDDQLRQFQAQTGMAAYPGFAWGDKETDNSILWDDSQFELVDASQFIIPFMGRPRPQPIVKLRHLATGREFYVVNTHPSAHDGRYLVERRRGQDTLVGIVNDLQESGLPVLVVGDMNDREEFYCRVMPPTGMVAPNGGSYSGGCQPPPQPLPVDWVVGSGVTWSNYWRDTSTVSQRISDHFFISATANVG
jgi:endonuclease/exonuclease/phosphatase family metal-dependent hydrolase